MLWVHLEVPSIGQSLKFKRDLSMTHHRLTRHFLTVIILGSTGIPPSFCDHNPLQKPTMIKIEKFTSAIPVLQEDLISTESNTEELDQLSRAYTSQT